MSKTIQIISGFVLVLVGMTALAVAEDPPPRPMNVLFLVSDDLRPDLGCYGNTVVKSPNIDRLAERGVIFNRAYCQQAICSASRCSVMTGMRPDTTKVWDLNTHFRKALPDVVTLPKLFRDNGYTTRGLGKIYHGKYGDPDGWSSPGISESDWRKTHKKKLAEDADLAGPAPDEFNNVTNAPLTKTDRGRAFNASELAANGGGEGHLADQAIESLREFKEDGKPFFLAVGFHKPHLPFSAPRAWWDLYDADDIPPPANRFLPANAPKYALVEKAELWNYSGVPDVPHLPDDYTQLLRHGYYACVSYMDAQLGRVVDELERLDMADNTIIVLWGDHGWKLGEHDRWAKHSNFENDARAPLIILNPGMKTAGKHSDALVELLDIYPTIVDLAGVAVAEDLQGKSLTPLLVNPDQPWEETALSQYPRTVKGKRLMGYSLRTGRYRFTQWVHRNDPTKVDAIELYDHQNDPEENVNVAGLSENEAVVKDLTKLFNQRYKPDSAKPKRSSKSK